MRNSYRRPLNPEQTPKPPAYGLNMFLFIFVCILLHFHFAHKCLCWFAFFSCCSVAKFYLNVKNQEKEVTWCHNVAKLNEIYLFLLLKNDHIFSILKYTWCAKLNEKKREDSLFHCNHIETLNWQYEIRTSTHKKFTCTFLYTTWHRY